MKVKIHFITALTALCLVHIAVNAQVYPNTPVTVSADRVKVNGKIFYAHPVLDHQTLYSISKAYNVTIDEIVAANPELALKENGLKTGQILNIPDNGQLSAAAEAETQPQNENVAPAPQEQKEPKIQEQERDDQAYTVYVAKWYDDLGSIAARFNTSKEVLMAFNGLTTQKLGKKQKIKIPLHPENVVTGQAEATGDADTELSHAGQAIKSGIEAADSLVQAAGDKIGQLFHRKSETINVAVVLPFNAKSKPDGSAFDLYSGMLLAARDLGKSGIKLNLKVIDSKNSLTPVKSESLEDADFVFGPVSPDDLRNILGVCPSSTAVISPLDPRAGTLAAAHSNFIQAPSSADNQFAEIVRWIREDTKAGDKVVMISEKGAAQTKVASYLADSGIEYTSFSYGILEGRTISFDRYMSTAGTTRVVIASDKEAFVNDAVRNLNLMTHRKFDVVLYGPSKIRNYETIDIESLHAVQAHVASSYFIDYDNARQKNFLLSYRALFGAEPTPFAYQGYDALWYFARSYDRYGSSWLEEMTGFEEKGLQSDFRLERSSEGGYANYAVRRAVYGTDFTIKVIK